MAVKGRWGTLTKMNKLYIKVMAARIKLFFQGGGRKLTIYGVISHTNDYRRYTVHIRSSAFMLTMGYMQRSVRHMNLPYTESNR